MNASQTTNFPIFRVQLGEFNAWGTTINGLAADIADGERFHGIRHDETQMEVFARSPLGGPWKHMGTGFTALARARR